MEFKDHPPCVGSGDEGDAKVSRSLSRSASARLMPNAAPLNLSSASPPGSNGKHDSGGEALEDSSTYTTRGPLSGGLGEVGALGSRQQLDRTASISRPWLWGEGDGRTVMTGAEFRERVFKANGEFDRGAFDAIWKDLLVLARCSPQDKYTIVKGGPCLPPPHLSLKETAAPTRTTQKKKETERGMARRRRSNKRCSRR